MAKNPALSRRANQIAKELGIDAASINAEVFLNAKQAQILLLKELETTLKQVSSKSKTGAMVGYKATTRIDPLPVDANGIAAYSLVGFIESSPAHTALGLNVFDILDTGRKSFTVQARNVRKAPKAKRGKKYTKESRPIAAHTRTTKNGTIVQVPAYTQIKIIRDRSGPPREDGRRYNGRQGLIPLWNQSKKVGARIGVGQRNRIQTASNQSGIPLRIEPRTQQRLLKITTTLVPRYDKKNTLGKGKQVEQSVPVKTIRQQSENPLQFTDSVGAQGPLNLYDRTLKRYRDKLDQATFKTTGLFGATTKAIKLKAPGRRRKAILSREDVVGLSKDFQKRIALFSTGLRDSPPGAEFQRRLQREVNRLRRNSPAILSDDDLVINITIITSYL